MNKHAEVHEVKRVTCYVCSKTFSNKYKLAKHVISHTIQYQPEKYFACHVCCKKYKRKQYLDRHATIHEKKDEQNKCDLNEHLESHYKNPFACAECDKSFTNKYKLSRPLKIQ